MKTTISTILAGMIAVSSLATTINIPSDYPTIQQGVDACSANDTVMVENGTYVENVSIYTPISLIGEDRDGTIIDGGGSGDVVFINVSGVLVRDFTLRYSGAGYLTAGIELNMADSCVVDRCRFEYNFAGISLCGSSHNVIARCEFQSNANGIQLREDSLVFVPDNTGNLIRNNIIENSDSAGIHFEHTFECHHTSNVVKGNRVLSNHLGISTIMSQENSFSYNDIEGSVDYGALHGMCFGGGQHNTWHHNNIISNHGDTLQACDIGGGIDYWYSVADSEGNYWSDYTGPDNNGDGIGDIPYDIDGNESHDLAPLMLSLESIIAGSVSDGFEPIEGVHVQASGTSIDDYTDSDGAYSLEGLGAGMYDVSFAHPLYRDTVIASVPATLNFATWLYAVMEPLTRIDNIPSMPSDLTLYQNYPNPFNAETRFKFVVPRYQDIELTVYDLLGKEIRILIDERLQPGIHVVNFDALDLPSGVYFYRLQAGDNVQTRRMVLLI
jgi:parallel beta-helix repeat protein